MAEGHTFKSQTDTEVLAHLVEHYLKTAGRLGFLSLLGGLARALGIGPHALGSRLGRGRRLRLGGDLGEHKETGENQGQGLMNGAHVQETG